MKVPPLLAMLLIGSTALAQPAVRVEIDPKSAGMNLADFSGLSFEMRGVLADDKGNHYFRADNKPLIKLFKTLGIRSLRVGGNTADRDPKTPTNDDIDNLFAFAKAADVKVIYTLKLMNADPAAAVPSAKYIMDHYADQVHSFAIGNEPNVFTTDYALFMSTWKKYADTILAVAPGARFSGPSSTGTQMFWARDFARDMKGDPRVTLITFHLYPGGNSAKVTDNAKARAQILSDEFHAQYQKQYDDIGAKILSHGFAYRMEEVNSFWNGGRKDVSDSLASALWGLDYMYWWASHGISGLNFHTGDYVARESPARCDYAVFWSSERGYAVHPLAYAFKAFDLARHGRLLAAPAIARPEGTKLSAYAVLGDEQNLYITLINRQAGATGVIVSAGSSFTKGESMTLTAPDGDLAAQSTVTLGSASIQEDGTWLGRWSHLPALSSGQFPLNLPAGAAIVVKLSPN